MSRVTLLFLTSLVLASSGAAAGDLKPDPLPVGESTPTWQGPQFVQANRVGNVFFFRAETLEVYPVTKAGAFGQPFRLETAAENAGFVRDAVLSPAGDQWLLLADLSVRRFVDGKEKISPPLEWQPWAIGFRRDTPIAAVIPRFLGRVRDLDKASEIPWLLTLGSDRWDTLSRLSGMSPPQLAKKGGMNDVIAENSVNLATDREGKLWAARQYAYRVQRFSPGGRVLLEITVNHGEVRRRKESRGVEIKLHGAAVNPDATSNTKAEKAMYYPFTAEAVILDLTEGRDGRLYFLVRTPEGGMALDRYDRAASLLERVHLQLNVPGVVTIAAGRDSLYLAAWQGDKGRWRLPWAELEEATWEPVEGVEIDGIAVDSIATKPDPPKPKATLRKPS